MCGYVGFTGSQSKTEKAKILAPMMERILHRGPDMAGEYFDENIALGFRRLSIIDLSKAGAQPMCNENGNIHVVFNGEIYNFQELGQELKAAGHIFSSGADTEVIVHAYEEWGQDMLPKLRGMFSFAVWNHAENSLFLARDPFGIKPIYYTLTKNKNLIFGSEIKSFLDHPDFEKELNFDILRSYLSFQYAAGSNTFFKGVLSLPPGHSVVWANGEVQLTRYFTVNFCPDTALTFEQCSCLINDEVKESVQAHCKSDVPVGSFLSGGVDSSYITACLMPEKTFSVGFSPSAQDAQDKFNETNYAEELSQRLGLKNYSKLLSAEECFAEFARMQYHMDQPQSNPSSVPLWFLAKLAREHVTVVFSGEGADELFAGYELYADTPAMRHYKKLPRFLRALIGRFASALPQMKGRNFLLKSTESPENWFIGQAQVFDDKQALSILKPKFRQGPSAKEMVNRLYQEVENEAELIKKQYIDINLWMPGDILLKADKMCMAHSLEVRVPLLDKKIMSLAERIPCEYQVQGTKTKQVFRHAANKTLPDEWANRPKKGFPVPIRHWLREKKYYTLVREYFTSDYAGIFFDISKICRILDEHYSGKSSNARKIWTVFTFLVWYKRFFIDESSENSRNGELAE